MNKHLWLPVLLGVCLHMSAQAEEGEIVISRQVQPRVASVPSLVPDPAPRVVNPGSAALGAGTELNDGDFSRISSGRTITERTINDHVINGAISILPSHTLQRSTVSSSSVSRQGDIATQVSRSVQQGLRPLHILGGR